MRINNNMSAVITNKQLLRTENNLTKSMERLSSGLKINHAKDNPAGMAISNKMQTEHLPMHPMELLYFRSQMAH